VVEAASSCVRAASTMLPSVEGVAVYREAYERYVRLYDATRRWMSTGDCVSFEP